MHNTRSKILFADPFDVGRKAPKSGFDAILARLNLSRKTRVLDLGAGGFCGETTTKHLLKRFPNHVQAIEFRPELAQKLSEAFADTKLQVTTGDAFAADLAGYDLIVSDMDSQLLIRQLTELRERAQVALPPGGIFISVFVYDCDAVFEGADPLVAPSNRPPIEALLREIGGSPTVTAESLTPYFDTHGFEVLGVVNKWLDPMDRRGVGWLGLRKQGGPSLTSFGHRLARIWSR